jgi:uncharacterized protein (DUF1330 family)
VPIGPTREQIVELVEGPSDKPVVMLNLLKFAERAADADESAGASGKTGGGQSGQESYRAYGEGVRALLEKVGAKVLWQGGVDSVVIGDEADRWDAVILVEYPSRQAFIEMTSGKDYGEVSRKRTAGLADSRLIAMTEVYRAG